MERWRGLGCETCLEQLGELHTWSIDRKGDPPDVEDDHPVQHRRASPVDYHPASSSLGYGYPAEDDVQVKHWVPAVGRR